MPPIPPDTVAEILRLETILESLAAERDTHPQHSPDFETIDGDHIRVDAQRQALIASLTVEQSLDFEERRHALKLQRLP